METAREPESSQLCIDPATRDDLHALLDSLSYEFGSFLHRKKQAQKRRDDENSSQTRLRQEEDVALTATGAAKDLALAATRKAQDDQKAQARMEEDTELERIRADIRGRGDRLFEFGPEISLVLLEIIQDVLTERTRRQLPHVEHDSPQKDAGRRPSASYERQSKINADSFERGICSPIIVEDHPDKSDLQKTSDGDRGCATD